MNVGVLEERTVDSR